MSLDAVEEVMNAALTPDEKSAIEWMKLVAALHPEGWRTMEEFLPIVQENQSTIIDLLTGAYHTVKAVIEAFPPSDPEAMRVVLSAMRSAEKLAIALEAAGVDTDKIKFS